MKEASFEREKGTIKRFTCGQDNVYLVEQSGRKALVDTGRTSSRSELLAALARYGDDVILLTHGHFDHVQNAAFFSREFAAPIALSAADMPLIASNATQTMSASTLPGKVLMRKFAKEMRTEHIEPFEPSMLLREGFPLYEFGFDANVIALPGHTMGSMGFDFWGSDVFVGDALISIPSAQRALMWHDAQAVEESCQRISNMGTRTVHFGHGTEHSNRIW